MYRKIKRPFSTARVRPPHATLLPLVPAPGVGPPRAARPGTRLARALPEAPRASGWPALEAASRPQVRTARTGAWGRRGGAAGAAAGEDCGKRDKSLKRLIQKLRGAAAATGAHAGTARTRERLVPTCGGVLRTAMTKGAADGQRRDALGRRKRRTARSPHPRAGCGETSGGAGDGGVLPPQGSGRRRVGDARGAVRQRPRRRLPGGPGPGQWEGGLQQVSDDARCA
jgi:hypothetical protein